MGCGGSKDEIAVKPGNIGSKKDSPRQVEVKNPNLVSASTKSPTAANVNKVAPIETGAAA